VPKAALPRHAPSPQVPVILAGGLASDFTMGELQAYIFPRGLASPRPIATAPSFPTASSMTLATDQEISKSGMVEALIPDLVEWRVQPEKTILHQRQIKPEQPSILAPVFHLVVI
jgi:hypothetical protein